MTCNDDKKFIEIAHASHQGIVKTKQLIREKVWFPGIDKKVEQAVKSCIPCLACVPSPAQREPLSMTTLPSGPWIEVAVDLAGPFPSGEYLFVVIAGSQKLMSFHLPLPKLLFHILT